MMKKLHTNILERLDLIIKETTDHIHDFIDSKLLLPENVNWMLLTMIVNLWAPLLP